MLDKDKVNRRKAELEREIDELKKELSELDDMLWEYENGHIDMAKKHWQYEWYEVDDE